jgi:predicted phage terminase large subunit-like protein
VLWSPNSQPQRRFLSTTAREVLYGGAAGGGKSAALTAMPLRWANHPDFAALVLRRESTQLGDLLNKARKLWPKAFPGARPKAKPPTWYFPSGASVRFNHCEHESDASIYDGYEYQLIQFDELTHFTRTQFLAITARLRAAVPGLPRYVRCTTNPGGPGHEWVFERWGAWLDPDFQAEGLKPRFGPDGKKLPPAQPGEVLWYVLDGSDDDEKAREVYVPEGTPDSLSRTFIPALASDNPDLTKNDPKYMTTLRALDRVRRAQLLGGNWLVKPAKGLYFKRAWIQQYFDEYIRTASARVRYWDLAAGGDFAAGLRYARNAPLWVVEHVRRLKGTPHEVRQAVFATAQQDGKSVPIWIEQDPGQAGKDQAFSYQTAPELQGYMVRFRPKRIDKITAFGPVSSQAEGGLIGIVRGAWNDDLFGEAEGFPEVKNDDQVDAWSGAHAVLTGGVVGSFTEAANAFAGMGRRS